jgi:hypothetical protein
LEDVDAEGRCRDHRIGGVGHRRMSEPLFRLSTLVAYALRDAVAVRATRASCGHRCRKRPRFARPPEGAITIVRTWGATARAFGHSLLPGPRLALAPSGPPSPLCVPPTLSTPLVPLVTATDESGGECGSLVPPGPPTFLVPRGTTAVARALGWWRQKINLGGL